jgi:hypothetical protein
VHRAARAQVRIPPGSKPAHAKVHSDLRLHKFTLCPRREHLGGNTAGPTPKSLVSLAGATLGIATRERLRNRATTIAVDGSNLSHHEH